MYKLARCHDGIVYYRLERPYELDKLQFDEFTYFRKYLGMNDYIGNFKSWLGRQNVLLLVAVLKGMVIGWVMNEKWNEPSIDGKPVTVLRAVEVSPQITRNGIGKTLFRLSSEILVGHIITKPVNEAARNFFMSLDFEPPDKSSPINLSNHPGYLILRADKKSSIEIKEEITIFEEAILKSKSLLFASEMVEIAKNAARSGYFSKNNTNRVIGNPSDVPGNQLTIENEKSSSSDLLVHLTTVSMPVSELPVSGTLIGFQKLMSPCICGEFRARIYDVSDDREGSAVICTGCGRERYFLSQKRINKK